MPFALPVLTFAWKIGLTAGIVLLLVGSCMLRDASIRNEGAQKAVAKITRQSNEHGTKAAKKAAEKLDAARKPGSFDRLRSDPRTCPDCDR